MQHDAISRWVNFALLSLSARTVEAYRLELCRLVAWASPSGQDLLMLSEDDLTAYLAERLAAGVGAASRAMSVAALRRFYAWAELPAADRLPFPPPDEKEQRTLSDTEIAAVFASCDTSNRFGVRDLSIFMLLWDSGLRASELCRLAVDRLKVDARIFFVLAKGYRGHRRERFGYFSEETANMLLRWLALREQFAKPSVGEVFVALSACGRGEALTRRGLQDVCSRAAERAGVEHFSPHAFRRGLVSEALAADAPDEVVRRFMGWESGKMVQVYARVARPGGFARFLGTPRVLKRTGGGLVGR